MTDKCPLCGKDTAEKFRPFCSSRCATLDLGKWLGEGYRLPVEDDNDEDGASLPNRAEDEEIH